MKKLLLNSCFCFILAGIVFFSCSGGSNTNEKTTPVSMADSITRADTAVKTSTIVNSTNPGGNVSTPGNTVKTGKSSAGNAVTSGQSNTGNPGRDTVLRDKTAVTNNSQNQAYIDSVKAAKTKKKK
jgi:hypothetical protein